MGSSVISTSGRNLTPAQKDSSPLSALLKASSTGIRNDNFPQNVAILVLHALVKAGVIEQLREQPKRLPELAQACGLNADVLYRAFRFARVIDVVTQDGEQYALTDVGQLLLKDVPGSLYMGLLLMGSEPWQRAWNNFTNALKQVCKAGSITPVTRTRGGCAAACSGILQFRQSLVQSCLRQTKSTQAL